MTKIILNGKEYDLTAIHNAEYYTVEEDEDNPGQKVVKVDGYLWDYGYLDDEDWEGTWRHSYYCWAYIPITDTPIEWDDVNDIECNSEMYENEGISEENAAYYAMHYFEEFCDTDPAPIIPLLIENVTKDTPCGFYVNIEP